MTGEPIEPYDVTDGQPRRESLAGRRLFQVVPILGEPSPRSDVGAASTEGLQPFRDCEEPQRGERQRDDQHECTEISGDAAVRHGVDRYPDDVAGPEADRQEATRREDVPSP